MAKALLAFSTAVPTKKTKKRGRKLKSEFSLLQRAPSCAARISSLVILACRAVEILGCLCFGLCVCSKKNKQKKSPYGHVNKVKCKVSLSGEVTSDSCRGSPETIFKWKDIASSVRDGSSRKAATSLGWMAYTDVSGSTLITTCFLCFWVGGHQKGGLGAAVGGGILYKLQHGWLTMTSSYIHPHQLFQILPPLRFVIPFCSSTFQKCRLMAGTPTQQ